MTKLKVAFRNFANAPKNRSQDNTNLAEIRIRYVPNTSPHRCSYNGLHREM
jgi:hypothetical protein